MHIGTDFLRTVPDVGHERPNIAVEQPGFAFARSRLLTAAVASRAMMLSKTDVGVALGAAFGFLAALHVFWAFGGTWGAGAAVAEIDGRPRFVPSRGATLAVAAALIGAAVVVLVRADLILGFVPRWASQGAAGVLGAVFVLRAVGDFRLMGFFKSVKGTRFAVRDTWLYSPLCLLLGLGAWWLAFG